MFNIGYFKGQPAEYVLKYAGGRLAKEGQGIAFYYLRHNAQVVAVPTTSRDANFVFNETTKDFQAVTVQGQVTYRIHDPKQAASLLNFGLDPRTRAYLSNDPDRLSQRITNVIQIETRAELQKKSLEEALGGFEAIASTVRASVKAGKLLDSLGVELIGVFFVAAKPTPEVAQALEAEYRETLLRKADEAIYARRASAVEEEGKIKERELASDIAIEEQRRQLIDLKGENDLREAQELESRYRIESKKQELALYGGLEPRAVLALALNELGSHADRIGNLTITSEMLASLLNGQTSA
jgi:regulator of protease activity HflC (stomatin/prohibitin superfamily)